MCKCCQLCLESCYWHLIEERFCFDENIALYEEPIKREEKNNNMFDNMAFYDSVSVIAGRAIVTIEPLTPKQEVKAITLQPQPSRRLKWEIEDNPRTLTRSLSKSVPVIFEENVSTGSEDDISKNDGESNPSTSSSTTVLPENSNMLRPGDNSKVRKKSLRERRMSKSLYLKIDLPKELPIIRQQSMPKFFLETPDECQTDSVCFRPGNTTLTSPVINNSPEFEYDLKSVVQLQKSKSFHMQQAPVPVHKEASSSKIVQLREKIKLRKSKSSANTCNLEYNTHM